MANNINLDFTTPKGIWSHLKSHILTEDEYVRLRECVEYPKDLTKVLDCAVCSAAPESHFVFLCEDDAAECEASTSSTVICYNCACQQYSRPQPLSGHKCPSGSCQVDHQDAFDKISPQGQHTPFTKWNTMANDRVDATMVRCLRSGCEEYVTLGDLAEHHTRKCSKRMITECRFEYCDNLDLFPCTAEARDEHCATDCNRRLVKCPIEANEGCGCEKNGCDDEHSLHYDEVDAHVLHEHMGPEASVYLSYRLLTAEKLADARFAQLEQQITALSSHVQLLAARGGAAPPGAWRPGSPEQVAGPPAAQAAHVAALDALRRPGRSKRASVDTADGDLLAISTINDRKVQRLHMGYPVGFGPDAQRNDDAEKLWRGAVKGTHLPPNSGWRHACKQGKRNGYPAPDEVGEYDPPVGL